MRRLKLKAALVGLTMGAAVFAAPASAQAASSCQGTSGYWSCYSTTSAPVYHTTVRKSWVLQNTTGQTVNARCSVTTTNSYSSSSSQSVTATAKVELFKVAEVSVSGTQTFTNTLTVSEAAALEFTFKMAPHTSRTCQLIHGYYTVGTKYERWSAYKVVETRTGSTTVPFQWGLRLA